MSKIAAGVQLLSLELQTCHLVHPDWLPLSGIEFANVRQSCPASDNFELVMSRHLIDTYKLAPLTPGLFTHDWTYCVAGGYRAMQALIEQVTSYLLATWVRTTISGQHARELSSQVGQSVYQQSLQNDKTLQTWTTPKSVPTHLVEFLAQRSSVLVDGLWLNQSPGLAEWARLMTKPQSNNGNTDIVLTDLASDGSKPALPYSVSLLDEINQRLQVDFSIDVAGIFEGFAMNVSHAHAH